MNEDKNAKWIYGPVNLPISITIDPKEKDSITREEICKRFSDIIKNYTGVGDYVVDFDKIKRDPYAPTGVIILNYNYSTGEPKERSIYRYLVNMLYDYENRPLKDFDLVNWLKQGRNISDNNDIDSASVEDAYIGILYDQIRNKKSDDWKIVKNILKHKIKSLFRWGKEGSTFEVDDLIFRLDKLSKFNPDKYKFVKCYIKKNGRTLSNYVTACLKFDKQYANKLELDPQKHSAELRADLAMSGLNDDIV